MNTPFFNSARSANQADTIPTQSTQGSEDDSIDLRALVTTLWRGKWVILISTLVGAALAILAVLQQDPVYRASAKVMFGIQETNVVNIQDVLVEQAIEGGELQDQIEILNSTGLIERVITDLSLDADPRFNPALRPPEPSILDRLTEYIAVPIEIEELVQSSDDDEASVAAPDPIELQRRERLEVIANVRENLSFSPVRNSRVINIGFSSDNPRLSAAVANSVAEQYIVDQLEAKLEATRSATDWLAERVETLRRTLQDDENALELARADVSAQTGQTLDVTQQQLSALNASLAEQRSEVSRLQATFDRLNQAVQAGSDLGGISEFRASQIISNLRVRAAELEEEMVVLAGSVAEDHPARVSLRGQMDRVEEDILLEAARIIQAAGIDLNAAKEQEASLQREVRRLEDQTFELSRAQVRIRQLEREVDASRTLYQTFLARLQETTQQQDLQEADARILSPAEAPLYAESSSKRRIIFAGVVLSSLVGVAAVFLLEFMNNTFRSPQQLEELTGLRVLGVIPTGDGDGSRRSLLETILERPSSSLSEGIRNLRTSILFANPEKPPKVVMFTSSLPKEAKSSTALMTAMTSRQMGKSAVLVDCDLRLPSLAGVFDPPKDHPDLIDALEGNVLIEDAIYRDAETGLHMMLSGYKRVLDETSAADMLSSSSFGKLIEHLSKSYDLVVIDTPPVVIVTDSRIISRHADAVVYAVRWDETPQNAVFEGLKELQSIDAPIIGTVMTVVDERRASNYSYGGYSYYRGMYRNYYTD